MRVGLLYAPGPAEAAEGYRSILAQIEEADRNAIDSVLFEESHHPGGLAVACPLVCAAAVRTSAIRVGVANRTPTLEYPVHLAEDYAVADLVSRGRVVVGLSPGEEPEAFRACGVPWEERESRFWEAVEIIRGAWTQDSFQFVGEHYRFPLSAEGPPGRRREPFTGEYLDQWRRGQYVPQFLPVLPKPWQVPHPPLWVTGVGTDTVEAAARRGLSFMAPSWLTDAEVRDLAERYHAALEAAGRSAVEVEFAVAREVFLAAEGDEARALALPALRAHVERLRATATEETAAFSLMAGTDESELLDSCFLVGSQAEVIPRLKTLQADCGMTHLVARVWRQGQDHLSTMEAIRLLSAQVTVRLLA